MRPQTIAPGDLFIWPAYYKSVLRGERAPRVCMRSPYRSHQFSSRSKASLLRGIFTFRRSTTTLRLNLRYVRKLKHLAACIFNQLSIALIYARGARSASERVFQVEANRPCRKLVCHSSVKCSLCHSIIVLCLVLRCAHKPKHFAICISDQSSVILFCVKSTRNASACVSQVEASTVMFSRARLSIIGANASRPVIGGRGHP